MVLHFRKATSVFAKTLPFVLLRVGVGFLFGLLTVLYFGIVAGLVYVLGESLSSAIVIIIFALSAGIFLKGIQLLRKYVLYLVSAGHIAVIAEIVEHGTVPENQLTYGRNRVEANFVEASGLFALDKLIKTVLNEFNRAVIKATSLVDFVPTLQNLVTILRKAVTIAGSYLDEAVLAHIFLHEEKDNWTGARDGLVLYAKTWKKVLASTILVVLGLYVAGFLLLVALSPTALLIGSLPSPVGELFGWIVVLGLVATVHFGVIQPWVKTVVITTYLIEAREHTPDSQTMDALAERSSRFRELLTDGQGETTDTDSHGSANRPSQVDTAQD